MEGGAMTRSYTQIVVCPRCDRSVSSHCGRYSLHSITPDGDDHCPMSKQLIPLTGTRPLDYYRRATLVADLAAQVQDSDPAIVWDYLTATPATEIQRLMVIALAAINIDQPIDKLYGWVYDLPVARVS